MMDPLLGTLLAGTYRVKRLLGSGAMGAVYLAEHEALARTVALKVLAPSIAAQPAAVERLNREAKAAAKLVHPNIAGVTDFRALPGEPAFLVMEYIEGVSLEDAMQAEGPMAQARVASLGVQLLAALAVAHQAGVIHRDIKPGNLMLVSVPGAGEMLKVLDFGIAKVAGTHALTTEGSLIGSPLYMAPEQAFSDSLDGRADLYAVGATLYHAASGSPPLDADTLPRLLGMIRETAPMLLSRRSSHLSPEFGAVIERALAKRPGERFASALMMRDALLAFCSDSTASGPRVSSGAEHARTQFADSSTNPTSSAARVAVAASATPPALNAAASLPGTSATLASATTPKRSAAGAWLGAGLLGIGLMGGGAYVYRQRSVKHAVATPTATTAALVAVTPTLAPTATATGRGPTAEVAAAASQPAPVHTALIENAAPATGARATPAANTGTGAAAGASAAAPTASAPATTNTAKRTYAVSCYNSLTSNYTQTSDAVPGATAIAGRLLQCAPKGCYEPDGPNGRGTFFEYYDIQMDAAGHIGAISHPGMYCQAIDGCALAAIRGGSFPTPLNAGPIQITCTYRQR
jgi:eukaryotic-like serine/threonine-protein kinase